MKVNAPPPRTPLPWGHALTAQSIASPGMFRQRRLMQGCFSLFGPLFFLESRQYLREQGRYGRGQRSKFTRRTRRLVRLGPKEDRRDKKGDITARDQKRPNEETEPEGFGAKKMENETSGLQKETRTKRRAQLGLATGLRPSLCPLLRHATP